MRVALLFVVVLAAGCAASGTKRQVRETIEAVNYHQTDGRHVYEVDEDGTQLFVECILFEKYIGSITTTGTVKYFGPFDFCTGEDGNTISKKDLRQMRREQEDDT